MRWDDGEIESAFMRFWDDELNRRAAMAKWNVTKTATTYVAVADRPNAREFKHKFRADPSGASPNGLNPDLWIYPQNREEREDDKWYATEAIWFDYIQWNVELFRKAGYKFGSDPT